MSVLFAQKLATSLLFFVLFVCFILQVWEQVVKFYTGRTSEAVEKVSESSLLLPSITFCLNDPYKNDVLRRAGLHEGFFFALHSHLKNVTALPNLRRLWDSATYTRDEFNVVWRLFGGKATVKLKEINSLYNGKCFEWTLRDRVSKSNWIVKELLIRLPANKSGFAYFYDPHIPAIAPSMNKWGAPVQTMEIEQNRFYEKEIRLQYLNHLSSEAVPCQEVSSDRHQPYYECVQSRAEKIYSSLSERLDCSPNVTSPCWIPAAQSVVPKLAGNLTACRTFDELNCMIRSVKLAKLDWRSPCVRACRETAYKITTRRSSLQPVVQDGHTYRVIMRVFYGSNTVELINEYKVYDLGTIVGTVGGTMGLFLGFSCFHCLREVILVCLKRVYGKL